MVVWLLKALSSRAGVFNGGDNAPQGAFLEFKGAVMCKGALSGRWYAKGRFKNRGCIFNSKCTSPLSAPLYDKCSDGTSVTGAGVVCSNSFTRNPTLTPKGEKTQLIWLRCQPGQSYTPSTNIILIAVVLNIEGHADSQHNWVPQLSAPSILCFFYYIMCIFYYWSSVFIPGIIFLVNPH